MPKTIVVQISNEDILALDNDLLDIDDWVQKAVIGKIANASKRMINQAAGVLRRDGLPVPAADNAVIAALVAHPGYKNRRDREAS